MECITGSDLAKEVEGARGGLLLMSIQQEEGQLVIFQGQAAVIDPRLCFVVLLCLWSIPVLCTACQCPSI